MFSDVVVGNPFRELDAFNLYIKTTKGYSPQHKLQWHELYATVYSYLI